MDILVSENDGQRDHEIRLSAKSSGNKFISTDAVDDYKKCIACLLYTSGPPWYDAFDA